MVTLGTSTDVEVGDDVDVLGDLLGDAFLDHRRRQRLAALRADGVHGAGQHADGDDGGHESAHEVLHWGRGPKATLGILPS